MKTPHSTLQGQLQKLDVILCARWVLSSDLPSSFAQPAHERAHYDGLEQLHGT